MDHVGNNIVEETLIVSDDKERALRVAQCIHAFRHDAQRIVIDEVVGQMLTFAFAAGRYRLPVLDVLIGFGLFRLFDIVKPFPVRRLEQLRGGYGVMADDVGAGIYALIVLMLFRYLLGR